jgi:N-acetylmuramoyl-L-alanine amidase
MATKIYLSPSDQVSNKYAYGDTNEAVQCRRIADACEAALKRCGFEVKNNKTDSMAARCAESDRWGADLHVPIHTNAYNKSVTGTRLFCYSTGGAGYKACQAVFAALAPLTPGTSENIRANPGLYEVSNPNAPTVYIEVDFHDVAAVAKWIIENAEAIGEAIAKGICSYFGKTYVAPKPAKTYKVVLGEYATEEAAEKALGDIRLALEVARKQLAAAELLLGSTKVE